jgi:hypothetical protein
VVAEGLDAALDHLAREEERRVRRRQQHEHQRVERCGAQQGAGLRLEERDGEA